MYAPFDETSMYLLLNSAFPIGFNLLTVFPLSPTVNSRAGLSTLYSAINEFKLGKSKTLRKGDDVAIISTGSMLKTALDAAEILSKSKIKTVLDKNLLRPNDVNLQLANSAKFKKQTKWKAEVSFKKSVQKLLEECRKDIR